MRQRTLLLAVLAIASLSGCRQNQPGPPTPIKPFLITSNAGIDHEFYRDMSLDDFLKIPPPGSVDSVNVDFGQGPQVFVLVKVPDQPGRDLTKVRFETTFKTQAGQAIEKRWTAAEDRKSGAASAVFCMPPGVVGAETKVVPAGD